MQKININTIRLLEEALSTLFWYKRDLESFISRFCGFHRLSLHGINYNGSTKREAVAYFINFLSDNNKTDILLDLIKEVCEFSDFSHFNKIENGEIKAKEARENVEKLKKNSQSYFDKLLEDKKKKKKQAEFLSKKSEIANSKRKLEELKNTFIAITQIKNPQEKGRSFENFIYQLFDFFDLNPKKAYLNGNEQIDGAFTFENCDYILETKFTQKPIEHSDISIFQNKVSSKLDNTLGLFISYNGFTSGAQESPKGIRCNYLLMDGTELFLVLENRISLPELLRRKKEEAAMRGNPFYKFKG